MKYLLTLVFLFLTLQAQAVWSEFAHVTPDTQEKYKLDVSITPIVGSENRFLIRLEAVGYDHKLAWLIVSSETLSVKDQELRDYIWSAAKPEKEILIKTKLMPTGVGGFPSSDQGEKRFYEVELDSQFISRAYIYIDFPSQVFDGGYYYSVDLGSFLQTKTVIE